MKLNRKLVMVLALVMSLALATGSTLAYLTDTDADVNVMTLGSVKIVQNEQMRDENGELVPFENGQIAYPAVGPIEWADEGVEVNGTKYKVFTGELANVIDKIVTVTNIGKSPAYVRTIVAIEAPDYDPNNLIHVNVNITGVSNTAWTPVEIDGVDYVYSVFSYADVLAPGATSVPSLMQLFLDAKATNEDVEKFGDEWEVLVLSQAVQTAGFKTPADALDTAFGVANAENVATWMGETEVGSPGEKNETNNPPVFAEVTVSSNEELAEAIANGETLIGLTAGTFQMPAAAKGKTFTLFGAGPDTIIEVVPAGQGEANGQLDYSLDGSNVTFNDLTIKTNSQLYAGFARLSGTYNNCTIQNTYNLGVGNSVFNNCTFNITNEYLRVGGAYSAEFNGCTFNTDGRALLVFQDGTNVAQTVTVKDCTFNATAAANTWNGIHVAAVSIDGTNGTYVVNLEGNNTVDSDFNGLWQIKAGEANVTVNE